MCGLLLLVRSSQLRRVARALDVVPTRRLTLMDMNHDAMRTPVERSGFDYAIKNESSVSAVSWAAIAAGAFVAAAISLILLALGAGAGLSSLSPWSTAGVTAKTVGVGALVWLVAMELIAGSLGGYVAGRLRTKWVDVHSHEVYFRDTAHGFLAWAVSLVFSAAFLTSAAGMMAGNEHAMMNAKNDKSDSNPQAYYVDRLFRTDQIAIVPDAGTRAEISAIMAHGLTQGGLAPDEVHYVGGLIATHTGLSSAAAEDRLNQTFNSERQMLDDARTAAAHALYWLFVALLIGAFSASLAATIGGRRRDHVYEL
jgi:hypothetical protein